MVRRLWNHPAFWLGSVLLWAGVLWLLSSRALSSGGPGIPHLDKVAHWAYFTAGSFAFTRWLSILQPAVKKPALLAAGVAFAILMGLVDEFHQSFTPGRSGNDAGDLLADIVGGLCGAWLMDRLRATPRGESPS